MVQVAIRPSVVIHQPENSYKKLKSYLNNPYEGNIILKGNGKVIPNNAFYGSDIKSIKMPNSVECIGRNAFANCKYLTSITLPSNCKSIGDFAFGLCIGIRGYNLNEGLEEINSMAFYMNSRLSHMYIPSTVKKVKINAFAGCSNLELLSVSKDCKFYEDNGTEIPFDDLPSLLGFVTFKGEDVTINQY